MPLTIPDLDDRTFHDLVDEGRAMIAGIAQEWTNYNPSDPGVTLIELFAYVSEILIYRLNQITDDDLRAYLKLLGRPDWQAIPDPELTAELRKTILALRAPTRAITREDFERLAFEASPNVARAHAVTDRDLWAPRRGFRTSHPGHVSIVLVVKDAEQLQPAIDAVREYLEPRRLLTIRLHAGPPRYVNVSVRIALGIARTSSAASVRDEALRRIRRFFDPVSGGSDGTGWPFGRPAYVSEIYEILNSIPEVDFVTRQIDPKTGGPRDELAAPDGPPSRVQRSASGDVTALLLEPDELIQPQLDDAAIEIQVQGRSVGRRS
jgi:Baseplate J-like protein